MRDRERRVDLPKEPDSATARRERVLPVGPSCLDILSAGNAAVNRCGVDGSILVEDHGVRPFNAVFANVALIIGDIMQNEGRHGDLSAVWSLKTSLSALVE